MKITILKRLVVILMAVVILASAAVGVSAANQSLTSRGFGSGYCYQSGNYADNYDVYAYISSSSSFTVNAKNYNENSNGFVYWEFDLNQDYTYTCTFQATFSSSNSFASDAFKPYDGNPVFFSNKKVPAGSSVYFKDSTILSFADFNRISNTKYSVKVTVTFNPTLSNIALDHIAIYYPFYFGFSSETSVSVSNFSYTCSYDPGGDNLQKDYSGYFQQIISSGSGYPTPDGSALTEQGAAMSSAEGAVRDKSTSLASSVSTEWTQYQTSAKNAAVTLKPAASAVNNLYTLVIDAVPDEVIALFIAIAVLLFIGWLIGRVRE